VQSIDELVVSEPRLLQVDIDLLLQDVARLLPDRNPQQFLAQNPTVRSVSGYELRALARLAESNMQLPF
jgi:hypothetical protein